MRLFTTGQAAKICRLSAATIARKVDKGELRAFRDLKPKSPRIIPILNLVRFMKRNGIPLDRLSNDEQAKAIQLRDEICALQEKLHKAGKNGHANLANAILALMETEVNLESLELLRETVSVLEKQAAIRDQEGN